MGMTMEAGMVVHAYESQILGEWNIRITSLRPAEARTVSSRLAWATLSPKNKVKEINK